jgi:hypothetical protein
MAKKKHVLKKDHNFTLEEVTTALKAIIAKQLADPNVITVKMLLIENNLYPQLIEYWEKVSGEVVILVEKIRAIREARYEDLLLSDTAIPTTNILFYGKCALHLIEEQHIRQHATDKEVAKITTTNKIGFDADDQD